MQSFWERESYFKNIDVCIIGAGIVGLNAALHLKQTLPHLNILVVERSALPYGASLRNAGFACFGSVSEILEDIKTSNEQSVLTLIEQRWKGLLLLQKTIGINNLELEINGGYELFSANDSTLFNQCSSQISSLNKQLQPIIGSMNIYKNDDDSIAKFGFGNTAHLIKNNFEGQINTGKMMKALLNKVQSLGVDVLFGLSILKLDEDENYCHVVTPQFNFKSKKVLVCTNGFANQLINNLDIKPARAQVLITKPINGLKLKGTFHYDKGYYYFRNVGNRILFGGGRNLAFEQEATDEIQLTSIIQNQLDKILKDIILPHQSFEIDMRWSGIMGVGNEKLPIIKFVKKNIAVALRCNGMGIAMGSLTGANGAKLLAENL
jgi:glycine/D-amino acid oxidase-like deaminating enzyme